MSLYILTPHTLTSLCFKELIYSSRSHFSGGALIYGSAGTILYDPTEWIRRESSQDRRFIVVTGNYRVNIFGFLAGSDLASEDEDGLSGNYGQSVARIKILEIVLLCILMKMKCSCS